MKISIIIPTYNEAATIANLIIYLKKNKATEIIVSDAGSADNTIDLAKNAGAIAVTSPNKGRAAQMNYGASLATGDVLYFVHSDSFPPTSFVNDITNAVEQGYNLGRYQTKFNSTKFLLKLNAWFTKFDWFMCMGGDQTLFVTKKLFEKVGGYKQEMLIMEEYEFCVRAKKNERYKIFNNTTLVSARKYEGRSWLQVQKANYVIIKLYKKGATQLEMVNKYKELLAVKMLIDKCNILFLIYII
jgi:rSAM/selenodomain-associated transferase 2